jgi:hypothetical protein
MMIEPESALEGIGQIANHILLGNRDLRFINGEWTGEEYPSDLQYPCADGSTHNSIEVIVRNDLLVALLFGISMRRLRRYSFHNIRLSEIKGVVNGFGVDKRVGNPLK